MVAIFNFEIPIRLYVKSLAAGITYRVLQLLLILYILIFNIWFFKGYQRTENESGITEMKLKGSAILYDVNNLPFNGSKFIMDSVDTIIPPNQHSNLFLTTSMILTNNQTQGICDDIGTTCKTDDDCIDGLASSTKDGIFTGNCSANNFCEIYSWCPTEKQIKSDKIFYGNANLTDIASMTLYLKNSVIFSRFNRKLSNIPKDFTKEYISNCTYSRADPVDKNCPIIKLDDIIPREGREDLAKSGGVIDIIVRYNCNFDSRAECLPTYSFKRVDDSEIESSPGLNFRVARYETFDGTEVRHVAKVYGIQFRVVTLATAGKFDLSSLIIVLGSGIALLTIATTAAQFIVLYCVPSRKIYQKAIKREMPLPEDDEPLLSHSSSTSSLDDMNRLDESEESVHPEITEINQAYSNTFIV